MKNKLLLLPISTLIILFIVLIIVSSGCEIESNDTAEPNESTPSSNNQQVYTVECKNGQVFEYTDNIDSYCEDLISVYQYAANLVNNICEFPNMQKPYVNETFPSSSDITLLYSKSDVSGGCSSACCTAYLNGTVARLAGCGNSTGTGTQTGTGTGSGTGTGTSDTGVLKIWLGDSTVNRSVTIEVDNSPIGNLYYYCDSRPCDKPSSLCMLQKTVSVGNHTVYAYDEGSTTWGPSSVYVPSNNLCYGLK